MDQERFTRLHGKLVHAQTRKTKGLISTDQLRKFVRVIEAIEERFGPHYGGTVRATYAQCTTTKEYDNPPYTVVGYRGPYTSVSYRDGDYDVERVDGETDWREASREHIEGITLKILFQSPAAIPFAELEAAAALSPGLRLSWLWIDEDGSMCVMFSERRLICPPISGPV